MGENWVTIKNLKKKNPSVSLREIGRLLGVSHNTVKTALGKDSLPVYQLPEKVSKNIEPFEEVIFEMVNIKRYQCFGIFKNNSIYKRRRKNLT